MDTTPRSDEPVERALDRDTALLDSAVRMVAAGNARSVTVAGLSVALAAMAVVVPLAAELGITLEPLWSVDQTLTDIRVRLGR